MSSEQKSVPDSGGNPGQESKQFCSVCKEWLAMEVVPTGDGDDDGVVWYRCPQCQGFLPKLKSAEEAAAPAPAPAPAAEEPLDEDLPFDSPAEMMAARKAARADVGEGGDDSEPEAEGAVPATDAAIAEIVPDLDAVAGALPVDEAEPDETPADEEDPAEPVAEYAAQLAVALDALPPDAAGGQPYRPWETYEVGQCIQHLAWEDCGIVVGKESLPGGRLVIKVYFQEAGVVRLIEQAPQ